MATKRLEISVEKHELKVIHFGRSQKLFCLDCQTETKHLTVAQTAAALNMSEINIFRLAESKQIHTTELADGKLMICIDVLI